jgi:anti-sigma factor RsiW
MSAKRRHDIELMQHADGELDEHTARELDEQLAADADARAKVDALGELGEIVRGHLELSADAVPDKRFAAMWKEIDKRVELERDSTRTPAQAAATAPASVWRRMTRWFDHYRGHIITGAVSAGAVAALALFLRTSGTDGVSSSGRNPIDVRPVVHRPAEIESLDTPDGTGTVFNLEDEDGSTTVIWVTPADTVEGI